MGVINTGLTTAGVRAEFFERFEGATSYWQDLATKLPSTTETESFRFLGSIPQMREWGSGRLAKGLRSERYDISSQRYEATIEVDRAELEDDQTGQIRLRVAEMAEAAATHKDYLLELLLANGDAAGYLAYDGLPFFSDAHESDKSGVQSNKLTYAAADGTTPTAAEFRGSVAAAVAAMIAFKDDQGQPRRATPTGLVCVVPPPLLFTALESINATLVGTTADTFRNNPLSTAARVISLPGLTAAAKWFLLKVNTAIRPFVLVDRVPLEFTNLEVGSDHTFKTDKLLYGVRARYTMAFGYWQFAVQTTFT